MLANKFIEITKKFGSCPNCDSQEISNGGGTLSADSTSFLRICKCGCEVKITGIRGNQ